MRWKSLIARLADQESFSALGIMGLRVFMLAAKFLLGLFIIRFLGLEAMGIYGLINGSSAIVQVVMRGGVFSNLSRQAVNQPLHDLTLNIRLYGTGSFCLYAVCSPFILWAGWYFSMPEIVALSLIVVITEHICMDIFVLANNLHRPKLANILLSVQSASWIYVYMALALAFPSLRTLEWILSFWIGGGVVCLAATAWIARGWPWAQAFYAPFDRNWFGANMLTSWRIYAAEILNTLAIYQDRYLISLFFGLELAGIYVLFWQVTNAICNLVGAGILQVYRPRLITAHQKQDEAEFRRLFSECARRSLISTVGLGVLSAIAVPFLIGFTDHPMALAYISLLWLMLLSLLFRVGGDVCGYALYAQHRDDRVLISILLKLASAFIVGIISLYSFGINGAFLNIIAAGLSVMIYTYYVWKEKSDFSAAWKLPLRERKKLCRSFF